MFQFTRKNQRHTSKQMRFIKNMDDLLEVNSSRRSDAPVWNRKLLLRWEVGFLLPSSQTRRNV